MRYRIHPFSFVFKTMQNNRRWLIYGCLGLSILTIGCGNSKEANKGNFAKAIEKSLQTNATTLREVGSGRMESCFIHIGNKIPEQITQDLKSNLKPRANTILSRSASVPRMDILAEHGFFTSTVVKEQKDKFSHILVKEYSPTDLAKSKIISIDSGRHHYIPYCKIGLKEVKSYTEPADGMGATYSQVKYTYVINDIEDWAKNPAYHEQFPEVKAVMEKIGKPIDGEIALVLTNEGWTDSSIR
jgi:hypothetical protein